MQVFIASYRYYLMGCWDSVWDTTVGVYSSRELAEAALERAVAEVSDNDLVSKSVEEYPLDAPPSSEVE